MHSPYASMNNNPISNVDPLGDNPFLAAAVGATVATGIGLAIDAIDGGVDQGAGYYAGFFGAGAAIGYGVDSGWFNGLDKIGSSGNFPRININNLSNISSSGIWSTINTTLPTLLRPSPISRKLPTINSIVNSIDRPTGYSYLFFNGTNLSLYSTYINTNSPGAVIRNLVNSWPAVSGGANSAGIPPYLITTANNIRPRTTTTMVRDGVGFSMDIPNIFDPHTQLNRTRTLLRIHPDGEANGNWQVNNGSAGCIALQCNANQLNNFMTHMQNYLRNNNNIQVHIVYQRVVPATAR